MVGWLKRHKITDGIYRVLQEKLFDGSYIKRIYQDGSTIHANIHLSKRKERSDLEKILHNLKEEVGAIDVKIGQTRGKTIEILFGMNELEKLNFSESMLHPNTLQVEFPSAFGKHILDFEDGASCHLLNGGVTRMGKTCFLLYITTCIYLQNDGNVDLYISSAKLKDYYPFEGLPNVHLGKTQADMLVLLMAIEDEFTKRNDLLYSPQFRKATDAKSVRKLYPEHYHLFKPVFLIIDEYARFADSKKIQEKITELVETAGFVNIHIIIASQRPDASTVLKPRIRANLLVRMAFTTADKRNSEVILDREGAEKLGRIEGRGLLIDSDSQIIQVPYLDVTECDQLLEVYRNGKSETGPTDHEPSEPVQSMFEEPTSSPDVPTKLESSERREPSIEEIELEWGDHTNPTGT